MKILTAEQRKKMLSDKYRGVFPLQFSQGGEADGAKAIPDTIQLIPIGQWEHDAYGPILITAGDIREFAQNFNAAIRKGVFITAGHEGFAELPAVGWITRVEVRDTGLWGDVEWNELGKGTLADKQYKFFSPEFYRDYEDPQTHQIYRNVLIGGALTKSPYFKELEAIVFSEKKLANKFNNTMNLKDILAKKIEDLSVEEQAFVKEHKAELTDEQKTALTSIIDVETAEEKEAREAKEAADRATSDAKAKEDANVAAGLNADGSAKVNASENKGSRMIQMSETEAALLRKQADEGAQAFKELSLGKLNAAVDVLMFSESNKTGRFLPKAKDKVRAFIEKMTDAQRLSFSDLLKDLADPQKFTEQGVGAKAADGTAQAELDTKVNAKMTANPKMKYSDALKAVMAENKGLEERYDSELPSARKSVKA